MEISVLPAILGLLFVILCRVSADLPSFRNDDAYDGRRYGAFPVQMYFSSSVTSPRLNIWGRENLDDNENLYTFLAPHGRKVQHPGPVILDSKGHLVWANQSYHGVTTDLRMQWYKNQQYLTFWVGDTSVRGHGSGVFYMLDSSYELFKKIEARPGLNGDLHEFTITQDGHALYIVYGIRLADLSSILNIKRSGWIWECEIQEVDLETDTPVFEWRASEHHSWNASYRPLGREGTLKYPWDWFHMNSVEKDKLGNYLISSRYLRNIAYISGTTKEILWELGGKNSNFTDLSPNQAATNFAFQHHARWGPGNTITIFDNGADYEHTRYLPYSRGLSLTLNTQDMTVDLANEYYHHAKYSAQSQGSMQMLESGNVLLGYGNVAAFTEFFPNGSLAQDVHFGPVVNYRIDNVQSYRVFRSTWKGYPRTQPEIAVRDKTAYASWNGATQVSKWMLQDSDLRNGTDSDFRDCAQTPKVGFESSIFIDETTTRKYIRFAAADEQGAVLGVSESIDWKTEGTIHGRFSKQVTQWQLGHVLFWLCLSIAAWPILRLCRRLLNRFLARRSGDFGDLPMSKKPH